jgi:hypothetical protein
MADAKETPGGGPQKPPLQEDRIVAQLVSGAAQAPTGLTSYVGLLSRSPTAGRWRLYLSLDMSVYVEFREEDVVHSEQLAADKSPFGGLGGTQVFVKKGAEITSTQTVTRTVEAGGAEDEFDLDIRLGAPAAAAALPIPPPTAPIATCDTCHTDCGTCPGDTCVTCHTCNTQCGQATCHTCLTKCATCQTCLTCQTQCGQATCHTCAGQATCATCQTCLTKCGQHTCITCHTCGIQATCHTCLTCAACTHVTCFQGCGGTAALAC